MRYLIWSRKKNSCTPINPNKYSRNGLKNIHSKNLITKKISAARKFPTLPSNGPSLKKLRYWTGPVKSTRKGGNFKKSPKKVWRKKGTYRKRWIFIDYDETSSWVNKCWLGLTFDCLCYNSDLHFYDMGQTFSKRAGVSDLQSIIWSF